MSFATGKIDRCRRRDVLDAGFGSSAARLVDVENGAEDGF